jgi:hypothetical protein
VAVDGAAAVAAVVVALLRIAVIIIRLRRTPLVALEGRVADRQPLLLLLLLLPPLPPHPREQMMCRSHRLLRQRLLSQSLAPLRFAQALMLRIVCLPA